MKSRALSRYPLVALVLASVSLFASACAEKAPTQLVVWVDSDLPVPGQLDRIEVEVDSFGAQPVVVADVETQPLPRSVALLHEGGPLGPIEVEVRGSVRGSVTVSRRARVSFVPEEVKVLRLSLERSCRMLSCPESQSCQAGVCGSLDVAEDDLESYPPPDASDAGVGDLDAAMP